MSTSAFSFKEVVEVESTFKPFIKVYPGLHRILVEKVYFQPEGASVADEKAKDGSLVMFKAEQIRIKYKILETITAQHGDSKDAESTLSVYCPKQTNKKGDNVFDKEMSRLMHIFSNMASTKDKEKAVAYIQGIQAPDFKGLAAKLAFIKDRKATIKLVSDSNGKNAILPSYYQGMVECYDASPSKLTFDEKDKFPTAPTSPEIPAHIGEAPNWGVQPPVFGTELLPGEAPAVPVTIDDLPF